MVILLFLAIGIVCTIYYLKNKELKVYIDEKNASSSVSLFSIEDDDVYVSISGLAKKLGYTKLENINIDLMRIRQNAM